MTQSQPPKSRSIRRRPASVDAFIAAGAPDEEAVSPAQPAAPSISAAPPAATPSWNGALYLGVGLGVVALGVALLDLSWITGLLAPPVRPAALPAPGPASPSALPPAAAAIGPRAWVRWLTLNDLQLARQRLLSGRDELGLSSLEAAKRHLALLGRDGASERALLDQLMGQIRATPLLSLGQLDRDMEGLMQTWVKVNYGPQPGQADGSWIPVPDWVVSSWHELTGSEQTQNAGLNAADRRLLTLLDRLRWLALEVDEQGFWEAAARLEGLITPVFQAQPEGQHWLVWVRRLQQWPLRRKMTELDGLIARLAGQVTEAICELPAAASLRCPPPGPKGGH
jgi:hypothetical protein